MSYLQENNNKLMAALIIWMIQNRSQLNDVSKVLKEDKEYAILEF